MAYNLKWTNGGINGKTPIDVKVAQILPGEASLTFTGKGASNYGTVQQQNLMHLLENFADEAPPIRPTIGQSWYQFNDELAVGEKSGIRGRMKVCTEVGVGQDSTRGIWHELGWSELTTTFDTPPRYPTVGDEWIVKTGGASGYAFRYTGLGRYPVKDNKIGGWEQVFPVPTIVAARPEYDEILGLVTKLAGPIANGGNGLIGKVINNLTDLQSLDASLQAEFTRKGSDRNVAHPSTAASGLKVNVTSHDWDKLLAASKLIVNRLGGTPGADNISDIPFVDDGFQAAQSLLDLDQSDIRYPSLDRRINKKYGTLALGQAYTETYNTLVSAFENRYALRGINGTSDGAVPTSIKETKMFTLSGNATNGSNIEIKFLLSFNNTTERNIWLNSGGYLRMKLGFTGSGALSTFATSNGITHVNLDAGRLLSNATPSTMAAFYTGGFGAITGSTGNTMLDHTKDGVRQTVTVRNSSATTIEITYRLVVAGYTGTVSLGVSSVTDEMGQDGVLVFAKPKPFAGATDMVSKPSFMALS